MRRDPHSARTPPQTAKVGMRFRGVRRGREARGRKRGSKGREEKGSKREERG